MNSEIRKWAVEHVTKINPDIDAEEIVKRAKVISDFVDQEPGEDGFRRKLSDWVRNFDRNFHAPPQVAEQIVKSLIHAGLLK